MVSPPNPNLLQSDLTSVVSAFTTPDSGFHSQSIKDYYDLGKFTPESNKPRPIMVTNILATKGKLAQHFYIKLDMTI